MCTTPIKLCFPRKNTYPSSASSFIPQNGNSADHNISDKIIQLSSAEQGDISAFDNLNDPQLLQYVEDSVYAGLVDSFTSEDYIIEKVNAIYYSKEYLEEVAYNSKVNIFSAMILKNLIKNSKVDDMYFR